MYLYIIPLAFALIASLFNFVLNVKNYVFYKPFKWTCLVYENDEEVERQFSKIKIHDIICVSPKEKINFTGLVKTGMIFVSESKINGETSLIKKLPGDTIKQGSIVIHGNAHLEVMNLDKQICRPNKVQHTEIVKNIKLFQFILSIISLMLILLTLIFNKNELNTTLLAAICIIPCFANFLISIYLYIVSKTYHSFEVRDLTGIANLSQIDTFCFDKTGTITYLQSEVFKIVPIQHTALSTISRDDNRAFSQIISDVVKGNNETEGYFAALRDYFFYDLSKVVEYSSPLSKNGLYSLASFKGGKIYAVGDIDNFDLSNKEAMVSAANEYIGLGYKVLLLVEAKNIAKTGLIEGKSNGIGLIVLQETVKENIKIMIENLYQNHCDIKVISGDTLLNTSEACRKAGIANSEKAVSISKMSFEQLELIIDQNVVFANASMSQKAFIVENLRKNGHKVAFVGDGDNDTQAMKAADLALAVNDSSESALMCSHLKMDDQFVYDEETILASKKQNSNAKGIMVLNLSQSIAMAVFGLVFTIFNLFKNIVINPFTFNHVIMWTIFGVLLPSLLLMFDRRNKEYSKGSFQRNLIVASFAFIIPILTIYAFQLINYYGLGFIAIKSDYNELHEMIITSQVANNLSLLVLIVVSMFVTFKNFQPLNTYRIIALLSIFIVPIIYFVLLGFSIDSLNKITGITTNMITPVQYFVGIAASVISGSLYLLILNIVEIIKGEYTYAKSKSRS